MLGGVSRTVPNCTLWAKRLEVKAPSWLLGIKTTRYADESTGTQTFTQAWPYIRRY